MSISVSVPKAVIDADLNIGPGGVCGNSAMTGKPGNREVTECGGQDENINYVNVLLRIKATPGVKGDVASAVINGEHLALNFQRHCEINQLLIQPDGDVHLIASSGLVIVHGDVKGADGQSFADRLTALEQRL